MPVGYNLLDMDCTRYNRSLRKQRAHLDPSDAIAIGEIMLVNIIDKRSNRFAANTINAVLESSWKDNSEEGADQHEPSGGVHAETLMAVSLREAIVWADTFDDPVTLHVYDEAQDPNERICGDVMGPDGAA